MIKKLKSKRRFSGQFFLLQCMSKNEKSRFWFARETDLIGKNKVLKKIFILNITKNNTQIKQISSLK